MGTTFQLISKFVSAASQNKSSSNDLIFFHYISAMLRMKIDSVLGTDSAKNMCYRKKKGVRIYWGIN